MRRLFIGAACVLCVVTIMLFLMPATDPGSGRESTAEALMPGAVARPHGAATALSVADKLSDADGLEAVRHALAETSLAETDVPDTLRVNEHGELIVDAGALAVMEYFLSLTGELDAQTIRQLMQQWVDAVAGERAATSLLALFDQYQHYLTRLASGEFAAAGAADLQRQFQLREQLRIELFGAGQAASLFADQDQQDRFALRQQEIMRAQVSPAERERALEQLYQSLPAHLASQYRQQHQLQQLEQIEQQIIAAGGDDSDLFNHRQAQFGAGAAQRLAALDEARQTWHARLASYRQAREQILASAQTSADQQSQIALLRERLFSDNEQLRVAALDRMAQGPDSDAPTR